MTDREDAKAFFEAGYRLGKAHTALEKISDGLDGILDDMRDWTDDQLRTRLIHLQIIAQEELSRRWDR